MSTTRATGTTVAADRKFKGMPFLYQVSMLTIRAVKTTFRTPAAVIPGLLISGFFLLVYNDSLGGAANFIPGLGENSYLGFILPLSIISAALSGAGLAGESVVRDIETGYWDKLSLTPANRGAMVLSAMIAGAIGLLLQTSIVMVIALLMGLNSVTGIAGIVTVLGYSLLVGIAFSGLTVGVGLLTGNGAATQGASFLFFPLSFLTATFVPLSLLTGWVRTAAEYNPITYILEAMRAVLNTGWDTEVMIRGLGSCLLMAAVLYGFAFFGLRSRLKRR
ncbi:MAG: ABC transporter permease [Chloroflexota bacterium]|nr:ABC transporter permease [Chloroflexota bacterium]